MTRISKLPLMAALLLGGCTVGPDFRPPAPPPVTGYVRGAMAPQDNDAQRFIAGMPVPAQWWRQFGSARLNALVEQALAHNPDLAAAQAALRGARESVAAQQGFSYPTVTAGLSVNPRRDATGTLASLQVNNQTYFTLISPQVTVSYAPDVFGLNKRAVESLEAQAEVQRYAGEATYTMLIANVVSAALRRAMLADMLASAQQQVAQDRDILALLQRQRAMGAASEVDIAAQDAALAHTEALLPALVAQIGVQDNLIAALTGSLPSQGGENAFRLSNFTLPRNLPLSLPSRLVDQRPDIRASQAQLHAASASLGVAMAARLPAVSLTAGLGTVASSLSSLFAPENLFWSLGAGAAGTLFDGGTLQHREKAAEAALDVAQASYRRVVINAFQDVADTLVALSQDTQAVMAADRSAQTASRALEVALRRQTLGAGSSLAVLNARHAVAAAQDAVIQSRAQRLQDSAALFTALGGDWSSRVETSGGADDGSGHG